MQFGIELRDRRVLDAHRIRKRETTSTLNASFKSFFPLQRFEELALDLQGGNGKEKSQAELNYERVFLSLCEKSSQFLSFLAVEAYRESLISAFSILFGDNKQERETTSKT